MKDINKIFDTKYGGLIFALLSGSAYFIIILNLISNASPANGLIGFFFAPAIIFGSGLLLLKAVNKLRDEENYKKINIIVYAHIILLIISIIFLFDMIIK